MNHPDLTDEQLAQVPQIAHDIWEVAFGDDAFMKGYTDEEVICKLIRFSNKALAWDNMYQEAQPDDDDEDTQDNYDLREKMDAHLKGVENDKEI